MLTKSAIHSLGSNWGHVGTATHSYQAHFFVRTESVDVQSKGLGKGMWQVLSPNISKNVFYSLSAVLKGDDFMFNYIHFISILPLSSLYLQYSQLYEKQSQNIYIKVELEDLSFCQNSLMEQEKKSRKVISYWPYLLSVCCFVCFWFKRWSSV